MEELIPLKKLRQSCLLQIFESAQDPDATSGVFASASGCSLVLRRVLPFNRLKVDLAMH